MQFHTPDSLERTHGIRTFGQRPGLWQRLRSNLRDRARRAAARRKILSEYEELLAMPDYMLRDIALTRQQVIEERRNFLLFGTIPERR